MHNPQIYKGDPRPCIPPHVMVLSVMGLKLGYSDFCRPHMQNANEMCPRSSCGVSHVFIVMLRPHYIRIWWITVILIVGKTRIPPIGAPCRDKNGAGSGISLVYLWHSLYWVWCKGYEKVWNPVKVWWTSHCWVGYIISCTLLLTMNRY